MGVVMRIIQRFDVRREREFMTLERQFAELEARRPDYPKARRLQPIASTEPCNSLIWECEFRSLEDARQCLNFFHGDDAHERLLTRQMPFFESVRIEFYQTLDMGAEPATSISTPAQPRTRAAAKPKAGRKAKPKGRKQ